MARGFTYRRIHYRGRSDSTAAAIISLLFCQSRALHLMVLWGMPVPFTLLPAK